MTDDQTAEEMRVMRNTNPLIASEGVTFDNSFVSFPLCCPSRATFLTGQYAHHHGVLGNRLPYGGYTKLDHSNTLPVWLQRAGYDTALVGKYLNGYGLGNPKEIPPGWTHWYGLVDPTTRNYYNYKLNENGRVVEYGHARRHEARDYNTTLLTQKVTSILRSESTSGRPFFLWATYTAPHEGDPIEPDDANFAKVHLSTPARDIKYQGYFGHESLPKTPSYNEHDVSDKPPWIRKLDVLSTHAFKLTQRRYRQELEALLSVDDAVAKIVRVLKDTGQLDNTYIFFTSDNGYLHGQHRMFKGKLAPYEAALRVPLVVRGPGVKKALRVNDLVVNEDLAPTIVAITGAHAARRMDGRSLLPLLRGRTPTWRNDFLIESDPQDLGEDAPTFFGVRGERFKYVLYPESGFRELYDLARDPDETTNVANDPSYRSRRAQLAARLDALISPRERSRVVRLLHAETRAFNAHKGGTSRTWIVALVAVLLVVVAFLLRRFRVGQRSP